MTTTDPQHVTVADLADQAANAVRVLNHRTRPAIGDLADPSEVAQIIAALADLASMLPQLLDQLAGWLQHQHSHDRLRVDALAPLPNPAQTAHALTDNLRHAAQSAQRTALDLDTAHEHAAHLATAAALNRGQHPCRSVGPNHLTKRRHPADDCVPAYSCSQTASWRPSPADVARCLWPACGPRWPSRAIRLGVAQRQLGASPGRRWCGP